MRLGDQIGQYKVLDVVGHGGMAEVYVGQHNVVEHRVAIKVVHPRHLDNPRMAQRFLNEARAVAAIRHPGIVEFYDFGRADDGRAYLVMELLAGETLASRLERGPLRIAPAILFARQMASALGAAHERAIVHRDLKPANVFLVADPDVPSGERAKILDFGIAKHTEDREEITATGMMIGTPAHMSPEQIRGDKDIDGRADIYALGVLLYHMTTGRLPFEGGTGEIVSRHLYERCKRASSVDHRIPTELSDVIARCMEKDRARRYQTMAELVSALAEVADDLSGELTSVRIARGSSTRMKQTTPVDLFSTAPTVTAPVALPPRPSPTVPAPVLRAARREAAPTSTTLTRTIVDKTPWIVRARQRAGVPALLAAAIAATLLAIAASVVSLARWPSEPAVVARPAAHAPAVVRDRAPTDDGSADAPPDIEITTGDARPRPSHAHEPSRPARKAARAASHPTPAPAPAPAPPPPPPPQDPFADVATPAVY